MASQLDHRFSDITLRL